jgi:vancomycin resistance protein YoaR
MAWLRAVPWRRIAIWGGGGLAAMLLIAGVVFAGSSSRIAEGVTVGGLDFAGQTAPDAAEVLEARAAELANVPVVFTVEGKRYPLTPKELDAEVDWAAVAAGAAERGEWPMPLRGLKRLELRLFGSDVDPAATVFEPRLAKELDRMGAQVDKPGREAAIVLAGLEPSIVPGRDGRTLQRREAGDIVAHALAGFERRPVALPVVVAHPSVDEEDLKPVLEQVRAALSAPVHFGWRNASWIVRPNELAKLLRLPADGRSKLEIGGPYATKYFARLARGVDRRPVSAHYQIGDDGQHVKIAPSRPGRILNVEATARALLAAALSTDKRTVELVVDQVDPRLTTARAKTLGITRVLGTYSTLYSGTADRITNLKLAVNLIDGTVLRPGETFSYNHVVGPRTAARGFKIAPTIMDGEYKDAYGGGVSQVATTVFNAVWEAGLKITARTPHSLYISRYPLGRDATVNYPDVDLKFVNDTNHAIVMRGYVGPTGLTIGVLGAPTHRRVVSVAGEVKTTGEPEVERVPDPTLYVGEEVVEEEGTPAQSVKVQRIVYEGDKVLYDEVWYTSWLDEPKVIRVGTIPVKTPPTTTSPPPPPPPPTTSTATTPTGTTPTTTGPPGR